VASIRDFYPYNAMDDRGMLPAEWVCLRCGKPLDADGGRPAERYAGTYNGLCYPCTAAGPYVTEVAVPDGCRRLSYPPSCPSWRRDRETELAYPDCGRCLGTGRYTWAQSGRGRSRTSCEACRARYYAHPLRQAADRWLGLTRAASEAAFQAALDRAAGVPRRCPKKRRAVLLAALDAAQREALRQSHLAGYERLRALVLGELKARGFNAWRPPSEAEAQVRTRESPPCQRPGCGNGMEQHLDGTGICLAYNAGWMCGCPGFERSETA
jgi:hypothetical protein